MIGLELVEVVLELVAQALRLAAEVPQRLAQAAANARVEVDLEPIAGSAGRDFTSPISPSARATSIRRCVGRRR